MRGSTVKGETKIALMKKEAFESQDWDRFIFLHDPELRLSAFEAVGPYLEPDLYWNLLGQVWVLERTTFRAGAKWLSLMEKHPQHRASAMSSEALEVFERLPDGLTVYRGVSGEVETGLSWTLDLSVAEFFAFKFMFRHPGKGRVLRGEVDKRDIFFYSNERSEQEVVVDPLWVPYDVLREEEQKAS